MSAKLTSEFQATSVVSTNISKRLGVSSDLEQFAIGASDSYQPRTKSEYQQYRRFMHDLLVCGMIAGKFYDKESLTLGSLNLTSDDPNLMSQKPDLYSIDQDTIRVCEISLTYDYERTTSVKVTKYDKLFTFIQDKLGKSIQYKTLIIDLCDAEWIDSVPDIPKNHKEPLIRFVENLVKVHSTVDGSNFRSATSNNIEINFPFAYDRKSMIQEICDELSINTDTFINDKTIINNLIDGVDDKDPESAQAHDYYDKIADVILTMKPHQRPFPHPGPLEQLEFKAQWNDFKSKPSTSSKLPVIIPLGCPNLTDEIPTMSRSDLWDYLMTKESYGGYLDLIKATRSDKDEFVSTGKLVLSLTPSQLKLEMLDGPGRKKYMRQNNIVIPRKAPTHISPNENHEVLLGELIDIFNSIDPQDFLIKQEIPDESCVGPTVRSMIIKSIDKISTNGFDFLLTFYMRLSTEIIINSMRRRSGNEYILCHSGFDNVFFIVGPGPQLRTESNVIFVKLISFIEPIVHILSRTWHMIGDHWESDWLSVDTDRLKHWARCRHRVNLSLIGSAEKLITKDSEQISCLAQEINHGNYGLMALTYIEDKSLTSTTIQTTRYCLMKSLGDKQMSGILSKFPERVSSLIQSVVLQRCVNFTNFVCERDTSDFIRLSNVKRDESLGSLDETTTGVVGSVPRIFTKGEFVPIKYSFNEIYWCMMYNKDRQNATQDSMKILKKIAKEEQKFRDEIISRNDISEKVQHLFGFHTLDQDIDHIKTSEPESHYFSRRAVTLGIALQDIHSENFSPKSSWISNQKMHDILQKNLSEYATFKASVNEIQNLIELNDLNEIKKIGQRTKCIELVYQIVNDENLSKAHEVAMSFSGINSKNFKTVIQIFKKNQVGGVREILILYIKARILINLTEEISRLLSKSDKRETLTKGKDKRLMMRGDYEDLSSSYPENTPLLFVKNSYDMATWCQKFLPTIFLPIYNVHGPKLDGLKSLSEFVLLKHCVKEIEYPRKLVEQWSKHKDHDHEEPYMQKYKDDFLSTGVPKLVNMSNMGQGILHYNSTVMALSCQSLRDRLFRACLEKLTRPQSIKWKTRVGSDDKGDTISMDLTTDDYLYQAMLLDQCSSVSERLHSMELSVKSASGNVIYEFNSAYMANLEVQSPIIKFTLAAVDMIGTDSCTNFVNESYSRIRQMRENGATSFLCSMAHVYNMSHFNDIFRTGNGMINDPCEILKVPRSLIPYDLGNYPMYDSDVQDMIGPEYYNYTVFINPETPESILKLLYTSTLTVNENELIPGNDEGMFKKDVFNISKGLVRQLENMKNRLNLSSEKISEYLQTNPFLIIRGPMNPEETAIMIAAKLYTRGASESLRRTSPAIYMARLSAFESAKAWRLMFLNEESNEPESIKLTYREFLEKSHEAILNTQSNVDIKSFKQLIFPQHNSYEVVRQFCNVYGLRKRTNKLFSQSIRTWVMNNYNYNFSNSLKSILETSFGMSQSANREDVMEIRKAIPFDISSYESFIDNCITRNVKPLDLFFYLTKFYKNSVSKKAQVFAVGPSSTSLNLTMMNIKKYNHIVGSTMEMNVGIEDAQAERSITSSNIFDRLKLAFNMLMLNTQGALRHDNNHEFNILDEISIDSVTLSSLCETHIRDIKGISGLDNQMKKIVMMLASTVLSKPEFLSKLISWKQLSYTYLKKQKRSNEGDWYGDISVLVNYSNECYKINLTNGHHYIETNRINNTTDFNQSLMKMCKILEFQSEEFFTISNLRPNDYYRSNNQIFISHSYGKSKLQLNLQTNSRFKFTRINDLTDFKISYKLNRDSSTVIQLVSKDRGFITIAHYPGHYYPVEIPRQIELNENIFVNGLRITKLFKNRQWFFTGRLYPYNRKNAVEILKNHVRTDFLTKLQTDSQTRILDYIEEYDEIDRLAYEAPDDPRPYMPISNIPDEIREQYKQMSNGVSFMEMFQKASNDLAEQGWGDELESPTRLEDMKDDDEDIANFVRALGENKHKKRRDFYTITNLRLHVTFINRILDLFFKTNNILAEKAQDIANYAIHVKQLINGEESDNQLLHELYRYICGRLTILTGNPIEKIQFSIDELSKKRKHYNTLDKLNKYINPDDDDVLAMLGGFDGEDQISESEDEAY